MDTSAKDIHFDEMGVCNFCHEAIELRTKRLLPIEERNRQCERLIERCRQHGKGKSYDCIVGVSGGVDSSYMLHLAKRVFNLRPLAVHLDNGWNSELANNNIERLVNGTGVDLFTHVIDWEENRDLQRSFIKANVINIEALMDSAMLAVNFRMARKHKVKYILAGTNTSTEGFRMPAGWNHSNRDKRNIRAIHRRFGTIPISTHWLYGNLDSIWYEKMLRIRWISGLDFVDYVKADALKVLQADYGYRPYPYKHYESVFTRFYQGYILPKKFGVDKRRIHLSTLVVNGQMKRDEALEACQESAYPSLDDEREDYEYVIKKLGYSRDEFEHYLSSPAVPHNSYPSEASFYNAIYRTIRRIRTSKFITPKKVKN